MPLITDDDLLTVQPHPIQENALERFLSFCTIRKYLKRSSIVRSGDPADKLLYLVKGSVTVTAVDDDGNEVVLAYLKEKDFIGEIGLFCQFDSRAANVRARTSCEIAEISYLRLQELFQKELIAEHPHILAAAGLQLSQRLLKTSRRVAQLALMDAAGRIARTLLDMCQEPEALSHPEGTQIHISRQELARIVGCSREVVGRVLKQMAQDGMVEVSGMNIVVYHSR